MSTKKKTPFVAPGPVYNGELRTHLGNVGGCQNGTHLNWAQDGENFSMWDYDRRFAGLRWHFAITQLNNGKWLSSQFDYTLSDHSYTVKDGKFARCPKKWFDTREQAIRASVAELLRSARYLRRYAGPMYKIGPVEYEVVVKWLHAVLDKPAPKLYVPEPKPRVKEYHYLPEEAAVSVLSADEASNPQLMLLKEAP